MAQLIHRYLTPDSYTVGIICALQVELKASIAMLDEVHADPPSASDKNSYRFGKIAEHNVVIAVLPEIGNNNATTVATQLLNNFPSIRFGLLVGIAGGIPLEAENDIRLGDVVVSKPTKTSGGVVQYDLGSRTDGRFERTGTLKKPPAVLIEHLQKLRVQHMTKRNKISENILQMLERYPAMKEEQFFYQGAEHDMLYQARYYHQGGNNCGRCDRSKVIDRAPRETTLPMIHYGNIGSGDLVVKDGVMRESLKEDLGIICVEMEAAGLMDRFPCLVIRGICDYADSHKNNRWQPYASATAAAYAKELMSIIPAEEIQATKEALHTIQTSRYNPIILFGLRRLGLLSLLLGTYSAPMLSVQSECEYSPHDRGALAIGNLLGILCLVFSICSVVTGWLRWQLQRVCTGESNPALQLIWCNQALDLTLPIAVTLFRLGFCYCIACMMNNYEWVDKHLRLVILCCFIGLIIGAAFVRSATVLFVDVAPLAASTGIIWGIIADRYL